jgi:TM2 domain-containing membrane protein YozV
MRTAERNIETRKKIVEKYLYLKSKIGVMKDKSSAAILALFLGGIGVHRFYLNQIGLGFLYLIFCWTFIPMIISFFDFIFFLAMDEKKFNSKYNQEGTSFQRQQTNSADEIERLYGLKERGIISETEFQMKKTQLLIK